ncbi:M20 family metallo-hydrolase [Pseudalkalibacillus caeni]|uniref:M20 family metallo-hydrolase n=1 Tax=Exobacillus caeni TaxID=2574798 RepID=A0A5R9F5A2_9BACL|nr:M20 family metallo-hydrolase [Pseudalkalibacillus caeni]TLS38707.1 M20 family metallo-hydrolase [Pseudalkalibacillus caeni]
MSDIKPWLEKSLLALNTTNTMDVAEGFTRLSFSPEEKASHAQFLEISRDLGLQTHQDKAGNQWAIWEVDQAVPTVAVGSHLDTVTSGGGYDGVAGLLSGLAAVKELKDKQFLPKKNIAIICFVSEESARFGVSTIGSKALAGILDKEETGLVADKDGITIKKAVEEFGVEWEGIDEAELPAESLDCFLELHIEQGTQIEENKADIGIVKGIACPVRLKVTVKGMANHTGTTPMHNRKDSFVAIAPLVNFVSDRAKQISEVNKDPLVATVSTFELKPNVMNVIPGEVELGIDIRSVDDSSKRQFAVEIKEYCRRVVKEQKVEIIVSTLVDNDSILLDTGMQKKLADVCDDLGLKKHFMNSGAGHDVMNISAKWPSGLIFIPCRAGISHHPDEFASIEDMAKGVQVISGFLQRETAN